MKINIMKLMVFLFVGLVLTLMFCCKQKSNEKITNTLERIKQLPVHELAIKDSLGRTFIHRACAEGDSASLVYLISKGIPLDQPDDSGFTPLHLAVKHRKYIAIKTLLEQNADIWKLIPDSISLLDYAIKHNDVQSAELLYLSKNQHNYEIKTGNTNYKLGIEAIKLRYYSIIELIIYPMHYIVKRDKAEYFDHLLKSNKNLLSRGDEKNMTPLHIAYLYNNKRFIDILRSAGAKDAIDAYGKIPEDYCFENFAGMTSLNTLDEKTRAKLDDRMFDFLIHHNWLTLGAIKEGKIAYLRSYGNKNMIDEDAVYASVSKPVTSIIFMQLLRERKIKNVDDPISAYSKKYNNVMPKKYANDEITFRHLLTHHSGIPHIDKPLFLKGKLNLQFKPGEKFEYTTNGYSVLGEVMEEITGVSFSDLVKKYIGKPVGVESFWAEETYRAPGARIHSTTRDFAKFAEAIINNKYISVKDFDDILIGKGGYESLGWGGNRVGTDDLVIGHSGSNGKPRAHILIKPKKKLAVVLMGETKDSKSDIWFIYLAPILMDILENKGNY
jgi:CubicO group peptidase (beta-lactamase class C family)